MSHCAAGAARYYDHGPRPGLRSDLIVQRFNREPLNGSVTGDPAGDRTVPSESLTVPYGPHCSR
eukprot:717312-Hanusia_phi.AAC.1